MLDYFATAFGIDANRIAPSVRPRAASLFRCGALLGAVHVGAPYNTDGAHNLWDDIHLEVAHAERPPKLTCPVVSLSGSEDVCWPPRLVSRWADVAGEGGSRHVEFAGLEHQPLMNDKGAMREVSEELARLALAEVERLAEG